MVIALLIVTGLCLGSFVNALIWRIHEQSTETGKKRPNKKYLTQLSISRGRSMCTHCHHELSLVDLIPVLSWLMLRGKCRYCGKPIADSPIVELSVATLFVASYALWTVPITGLQVPVFICWLLLIVGLVALAVYDLRWLLLPNRILYPLFIIALVQALCVILAATNPISALINVVLSVVVGGGLFYILFQISGGRWIGGGDVKLGWLLGLIMATPERSVLMIFLAAFAGSVVSIPLIVRGRLNRKDVIPFGPFLILAAILVQFFGGDILSWYQHTLLLTN